MRGERGLTILEMLIVMMIVSLLVGLAYPSIGAGLDSLKLRSEADRAAALLTQSMARVERTQLPLELVIDRAAGVLAMRDPSGLQAREMRLDTGIRVAAILPPLTDEETARTLVLAPGEPFPGIAIVLANARGQKRLVRIDPLTAMAAVETPPESVSEEGTR
ncbi:MAG: pilus assembly FimT family protein [Acidobacteriota bacterium]